MKLGFAVLIVALLGTAIAESNAVGKRTFSQSTELGELFDRIKEAIHQRDEVSIENDDDASEIRRIIEQQGFDSDALLSDHDFLSGIAALFSKGDGRRWTTLNFVYQLACYQGRTGRLYGKAWWVWKTYNRYGCYCGAGKYQGNYLDATDYCCKIHDECYARVQKKYDLKLGCHTYTTPYHVSCCKEQRVTKCTDRGPSAGRELCECDQAMSKCVAQHKAKSSYNTYLYNNRSRCDDKSAGPEKTTSTLDLIKSCKHMNKPRRTFPLTYGSQGSCPRRTNTRSRRERRRQRRSWG